VSPGRRTPYCAHNSAYCTTPATANGDPFKGWQDRSGQVNHFTNSSSTATLGGAAQNGRNTLRLSAANDSFLLSSAFGPFFRGTQPVSIFIVTRQTATGGTALSFNTASENFGFDLRSLPPDR
jgi:hypothetical protein